MEKSEEEKRRDEKLKNKCLICLKCLFRVPKIDFINEGSKKMLVYLCSCGESYSNTISAYLTALSKLRINYTISGKCPSKLHPEANSSFYCFECKKEFCSECYKYHNEFNKTHYVIEKEKPKIINMCFAHNMVNTYYCSECNQSSCELCKDKHVKHSFTNIYKEKGLFTKGELNHKETVLSQIVDYINYVQNVYHRAIEEIPDVFSDQPGNYFEEAIKRLYDEERLIKLMFNNIEIEPNNIVSYMNLNTIDRMFPLHIIKDEINKFLYCSFFRRTTLFYNPHVEKRIKLVLKYFKKKKIKIGVLLCSDGDYYGEVLDDQKNGQGLMSLQEEEIFEGKWEKNILIDNIRIKIEDKKQSKKGKNGKKQDDSSVESFREERLKKDDSFSDHSGMRGRPRRAVRGRGGIRRESEPDSRSRSRSRSSEGSGSQEGSRSEHHSENSEHDEDNENFV